VKFSGEHDPPMKKPSLAGKSRSATKRSSSEPYSFCQRTLPSRSSRSTRALNLAERTGYSNPLLPATM
jgi:hypothetical protein